MSKKTVAWICLKYDGGGPPMEAALLGLNPDKYRTICIFLKKSSNLPCRLEEKGCKAFYISRKKFFRAFNLAAILKLAKILRTEKVDIIHCQRHQAVVYGTFAAKIARTPIIISHVHGLNRSKKPRRKFVNFIVLRWVNRIIAVSKAVKQDIILANLFIKPEKVTCLNNSIDYNRFANITISSKEAKNNIGLDSDSFVFGTVGRLVPTKGLEFLIDAFCKVKKQIPNSQLVIVGDGRLKNKLQNKADEHNLTDSVHFLGYRTDIPQILRAIDVFVMASLAEGMPGALLEAMASGIRCIATSVGGIPDVLDNGKFGILVPPQNTQELSEAMVNTANQVPENVMQIVEKAKQRIKQDYDHKVIINQLEKIYQNELKVLPIE